MKTVAISAPGYEFWITQLLNLSVITLVIGLSGDEEYLVPLHHLRIGVTFLANLSVELSPKFHYFRFIPF